MFYLIICSHSNIISRLKTTNRGCIEIYTQFFHNTKLENLIMIRNVSQRGRETRRFPLSRELQVIELLDWEGQKCCSAGAGAVGICRIYGYDAPPMLRINLLERASDLLQYKIIEVLKGAKPFVIYPITGGYV